MQSHALSDRVLTLTGRFSVFRATHIVSHEFIRLQEADFLEHWLWGRFRFLSGDDKSTWYTLLRHGVKMTYVPDAAGTTIEVVDGSGYQSHGRKPAALVRQHAAQRPARDRARPPSHAVLHLVVLRRPAHRHVDDAVLADAGDCRLAQARHRHSSWPMSSTSP